MLRFLVTAIWYREKLYSFPQATKHGLQGCKFARELCARMHVNNTIINLDADFAKYPMAPSKTGEAKKGKREKVFHPESRKAGQLARTQLRKSKLADQASKRYKRFSLQGTPTPVVVFCRSFA
jgi:Translation machinery-associated protein 16